VEIPLISSLRHYGGIKGNARKIRRLLDEFRFAPMGEIVEKLERAMSKK
jgi:hypothetical protein